ncbi:uncharacterized protein TNIN_445491 [Trichonephila inaurata madagascariensis]|uniref:Transposase n=1 Tax=Trichonephila inaurata madagascariensis TaxID=2747483 RepID=A0A8X6MKD5_9ARAC|nr:uncharacterized protein TNIN_445491 [Trichonephila inaurata madagascariensis]
MYPFSPIFFAKESVRDHSYLDMLQNCLMPQLEEDSQDFIFHQDESPPHFYNDVRRYLNEHLPQRLTGRDDKALLKWPPRSLVRGLTSFSAALSKTKSLSHYYLEIW